MKLIDEKGRLFGKINLIDLLVVVLIVAVIAAVVWKLGGKKAAAAVTNSAKKAVYTVEIEDVPADMWCCSYVSAIANAGIVNGVGNDRFNPNGKLTWAHIITVMTRFVEPQTCQLQNIQYDGWAAGAVQTAFALGWIEDGADFDPNAFITRGEFMEFVNNILALYLTI